MATQIGINGFGRIGRLVLRALIESNRDDIEVVAINDLGPVEKLALLFEFDSVHGRLPNHVTFDGDYLIVDSRKILVTAIKEPSNLPWHNVDVALECTGRYTNKNAAALHLNNGSRKVLVSAPCKDADNTVVFGVNHETIQPNHQIVSNASCTTNCLAPVAKVLHNSIGINKGFMTTVHSYTGDQPTLDALHTDSYRARAAGMSMIPTSTGAARAVGLVLPELKGKLDGVALRVPTPNVSVVDLTFEAARPTSIEEICDAIRDAAESSLTGILGYTTKPNVSSDFNHDSHSSIFHMDQTKVMEGVLCRVLSWYDNEWGFSNRMLDVADKLGAIN